MAARIFLARQEEQKRFREVLRSLQPQGVWWRENLPTLAKLLPAPKEVVSTAPHIFLLYGEGGLAKPVWEGDLLRLPNKNLRIALRFCGWIGKRQRMISLR